MPAAPVEARFRSRPNRFLVRASLGPRAVDAYLANPGRLAELLRPGVRVRLLRAVGRHRATSHDVLAARAGGEWVCLDTRLSNRAVAAALGRSTLPEFLGFADVRPEASLGGGRIDFLLRDPGRCWLEVKTASLVDGDRALFPDAPTARGARQLEDLARVRARGDRAAVLFLVVRDARRLAPNEAADPAFAGALRRAAGAGVEVVARRAALHGAALDLGRPVPVEL